jgi:SAM-dependent methyltransferase
LHAGCGREPLPPQFDGCEETRLDIDPATQPHIVASMTDLGAIGPFDCVYCSHALEHLMPHDVDRALAEFRRVLAPGGALIVLVPDLEDVRPDDTPLYVGPAGPVTGLDMYYGMRAALEAQPYMAHRTGFVSSTLKAALERAGFAARVVREQHYHLIGIGTNGTGELHRA